MNRRVVVTGGATISPLGQTWEESEARLRNRVSGIVPMTDWRQYKGLNTFLAAPALWTPPDYPRKKTRGMGKVALMSVHVAEKAFREAGLVDSPLLTSGSTGVSFGSSTGNVDALLDFYSMMSTHNTQWITATSFIRCMPQTCAVKIALFFNLHGRHFFVAF
jgi:3-oxoacyl-[acyl-carrier-protein] synthase II